ncbi:MAG: hypothetical protein IPI79_15705 [Moraxellaceae bacterium]|nr:hypothetical protein [Moraxellaceae bacterium]
MKFRTRYVFGDLCCVATLGLFWPKNTTELTMSSTKFNIKDAAKLYGMSRNTIYKALQEGRLSKYGWYVGVCLGLLGSLVNLHLNTQKTRAKTVLRTRLHRRKHNKNKRLYWKVNPKH